MQIDNVSKVFFMFKAIRILLWTCVFFRSKFFFLSNVHYSFQELKKYFEINILKRKSKILWNYFLYVQCKLKVDILFISVYFVQNYEFWKCVFTKVCMFYVVKNMDAQYTKYSKKNLIWNIIINSKIQNNTPTSECQLSNTILEKNFGFGAPSSYYYV